MTTIDFESALRSQPGELARMRDTVLSQLSRSPLPAWDSAETLGIVAMGASHNSGHAVVAALAARGHRAINLTASDILHAPRGYQPADRYLVVSESGRSPEAVEDADPLTVRRRRQYAGEDTPERCRRARTSLARSLA